MKITIAPYAAIDTVLYAEKPSHMITLLDPVTMIPTPAVIQPAYHLKVAMHDINAPRDGLIHPGPAHAAGLIAFLGGWHGDAPLLIHCWMGVSRSTAAAYIALCLANKGREDAAARYLRACGPHAQPNPLLVAEADRLMGRDGRMVAAVAALGPGDLATMGQPFSVSMRLDSGPETGRERGVA